MKRFEGKVVVVTGGCRNTGMEIVDLFLREGAKVFFCGSNDASVAEGVRALEGRGLSGFRALTCDVSRRADVEAMMDVIKREAGRLDVVVSNAANFGLGQGTCLETTDAQFQSVLDVNVLGGFRLVQLAANRFFLKQARNPRTGQCGVVVFVGSNSSERVSRNRITYVASNGHEATGADVAEAVAFLASDGARGFQGARIVMDGGSTAQLYPAACEDDTSKMRER